MPKIDIFADSILSEDFVDKLAEQIAEGKSQGLSSEENEKMVGEWFAENFVEIFTSKFIDEWKSQIEFGDVNEKWLEKYKTKEISDKLDKIIDDGDFGNTDKERGKLETILNVVTLLYKRDREFQFVKGKEAKTPEEIDALLFPSKKMKEVKGSLPWDIDSWSELNIIIYESNFREIRFQKIFSGKPSVDSLEKMPVGDLNLINFGYLPVEKISLYIDLIGSV